MKTNEIKEGNRLIAEFMGMEWFKNYWIIDNDITRTLRDLKYHYDWNWLMEVVEKIEELGFEVKIKSMWQHHRETKLNHFCEIYPSVFHHKDIKHFGISGKEKLNVVYICITKFIKWYNNQKH